MTSGDDLLATLVAAMGYLDDGREPVEADFRSKAAKAGSPGSRVTKANVHEHFGRERRNVGLNLGARSNGLTDVDCDCEEAAKLAPHFLPHTDAVFGRASARAAHWMYQTDLHLTEDRATIQHRDVDGKMLVELRTGGGGKAAQTIVPPSVHEGTGERIEWEAGKSGQPASVVGDRLRVAVQKLAAATLLARHWPDQGSRHETAMALGGFLARLGWGAEDIKAFAEAVAGVAGDDEAKDRARAAGDSMRKLEAGKPTTGLKRLGELVGPQVPAKVADILGYGGGALAVLEQMNADYAVVQDGGRTRVLRFDIEKQERDGKVIHEREVPVLLSFGDFGNYFSNQYVEVDGKPRPVGRWWLGHPKRRTYIGLTFQPTEEREVDGRLNLWRGWGVEPKPGDWSRMQRHIHEVLARGEAVSFDYILKWLAWAVQRPSERAEVALVFQGGRGTGKGTVGNAMCRIFGQHATHISSAEHLAGRFNAHQRDACLLFADEAYWPGDKASEGTLKRLVTEPTLFIEAKGRDGVSVPNMLHVLMAANDAWVVPAGEHERRFAVFTVSDEHRQDQGWFRPLHEQMEDGGLEAMLFDLLHRDLGDWHPRQIPMTDALRHQQLQSLQPVDKWVCGLLEDGVLPGKPGKPSDADPFPNRARSRSDGTGGVGLFDVARNTIPGLRNTDDQVLAAYLRTVLGCKAWRAADMRGWDFPPLMECRATWELKYPNWPWRYPDVEVWAERVTEDQSEQDTGDGRADSGNRRRRF